MSITLKAARVNAGLTIAEASKKLEITPNTLCNFENGKTEPKVSLAIKISKLYNIPFDEIFFAC